MEKDYDYTEVSDERKNDLFIGMLDYLCDKVSPETCVEVLKDIEMTKSEAEYFEFFDHITDNLPEVYDNPYEDFEQDNDFELE